MQDLSPNIRSVLSMAVGMDESTGLDVFAEVAFMKK